MTSKLPAAARLADIRAQIIKVRDDIEGMAAQPLPIADAMGRLDAWIAHNTARFDAGRAARTFTTDRALLGEVFAVQGLKTSENAVSTDLAPLLCTIFGAEIRQRLAAAIQAQTTTAGPSMAERPRVMAALEATLQRLETQEEQLIRESETAGERLARRADARPAVVLAI